MKTPRLTIAITTRNRADFIGETLDSIIPQLTEAVELLVLDGASTDATPEVMRQYVERCRALRYVRLEENNGPDRDFSRSVELASGEYCWLMADDDLLLPGAVEAVLDAVGRRPSLVIVNAEVRNANLSRVLESRRLKMASDFCFNPDDWDEFFKATAAYLSFIGCVVIRRSIWLERDKEPFFGSLFVHVGVIFQSRLPGRVLVLAQPRIAIRYGNAKWQPQQFEIWMLKWPALLWSFHGISDAAKRAVTSPRRWLELDRMLFYRAQGAYSLAEYQAWIRPRAVSVVEKLVAVLTACVPRVLANSIAVAGCLALRGRSSPGRVSTEMVLLDLKSSRYYIGNMLSWSKPTS
jgi:glycosyltransferase involved in cell wall biosynthesis